MAKEETAVTVGDREVRISNPSKVVFPKQGWTKLQVVGHFLHCGEGALRGVRDRPCLLKRWPRGVGAKPFFQKRVPEGFAGSAVDIVFPAAHPGRMRVAKHVADVIEMVQLGCIDLNPWPVRDSDTDHPDELRLDLDPTPGVPFDDMREVAGSIRALLDELGLVSWPKTTGSRGIHVYVRIEPRWTFHEVRRAALALAREVERRLPGVATTAWWKEERRGVFIDYNQMARDKTIASAYSVRETGLVSAPFAWNELADVTLEAFPMVGFAERWDATGDPMAGMDDAVCDLDPVMELVVADGKRGLGDAPWPPHYPKQPGEPPRVQPSKARREA